MKVGKEEGDYDRSEGTEKWIREGGSKMGQRDREDKEKRGIKEKENVNKRRTIGKETKHKGS
jgi:hypothetical protein